MVVRSMAILPLRTPRPRSSRVREKRQQRVAAVEANAAAAAAVPAAVAIAAAAVAAESGRLAWGPPLAPQRPKRTNRRAGLAPPWGRGPSESVRKRQRDMNSSYVPDRRPFGGQV